MFYVLGCWNISTSENPNFNMMMPAVPDINMMRIKVDFSQPTPVELTCIVFMQTSAALSLNQQRKVSMSYLDTFN
jgi:hypothetical protein